LLVKYNNKSLQTASSERSLTKGIDKFVSMGGWDEVGDLGT